MAQARADVFERMLQNAYEWLDDLADELGFGDPHRVLGAFRAVMHTIRDRLPMGEVSALAAEMPTLIRGIYFEGWRPLELRRERPPRRSDEFIERIEDRLGRSYGLYGADNMIGITRAVLSVVNRHISRGEVEDARHALPADVRRFWPATGGFGGFEELRL